MALMDKNVDIERPQEQSVTTSLVAKPHSAVDQKDLSKENSKLSKSKQDVTNEGGNNNIHHTPDNKSLSSLKRDPTLNSTVLALQRLKAANKFGTVSSASSCTKPANFGIKSNRNYLQPNSKYTQKGTKIIRAMIHYQVKCIPGKIMQIVLKNKKLITVCIN